MNTTSISGRIPPERIKVATCAVNTLLLSLYSGNAVSKFLGLNTSVHISKLLRDGYLSPSLENALVSHGLIEYRQRYHLVEACVECGDVHVMSKCASKPKRPRKKRSRITVNGEDVGSATKSIIRLGGAEFAKGLVTELIYELQQMETNT